MRQTRKARIENEKKAGLRKKTSGNWVDFAGKVVGQIASGVITFFLKMWFFGE
ncbi:hypothetical protein [Bacillus toyonensis]|uniref:hypothetical protein n=1 Tax=Bacillus toyonensis TaxID=155322 RepID=UPI002FFDDAAC